MDKDKLVELAEQCFQRGYDQAKWALNDAPWHDEGSKRRLMADAASCLTVAAALRSHAQKDIEND